MSLEMLIAILFGAFCFAAGFAICFEFIGRRRSRVDESEEVAGT